MHVPKKIGIKTEIAYRKKIKRKKFKIKWAKNTRNNAGEIHKIPNEKITCVKNNKAIVV